MHRRWHWGGGKRPKIAGCRDRSWTSRYSYSSCTPRSSWSRPNGVAKAMRVKTTINVMIFDIPVGNQYSSFLEAFPTGVSPLARHRRRPTWTRSRRCTSWAGQASCRGWILPDSWPLPLALQYQSWPLSGWEIGTVTTSGSGGTRLSFPPFQSVPPRMYRPASPIRACSMFWNLTGACEQFKKRWGNLWLTSSMVSLPGKECGSTLTSSPVHHV